jgi:hypothetical protein
MENSTDRQQDVIDGLDELNINTRLVLDVLAQFKDDSSKTYGALRRLEKSMKTMETYAGLCAVAASFYIFAIVKSWFN